MGLKERLGRFFGKKPEAVSVSKLTAKEKGILEGKRQREFERRERDRKLRDQYLEGKYDLFEQD